MSIQHASHSNTILDLLEKILDKGVVIAGDIKISLADVDLLTIKIRLIVASVDKAQQIGLDWWKNDPYFSTKAGYLENQNKQLLDRLERIENLLGDPHSPNISKETFKTSETSETKSID